MKSAERDRDIATIERELANPRKSEPAVQPSPPYKPVSGIGDEGARAVRRTLETPTPGGARKA